MHCRGVASGPNDPQRVCRAAWIDRHRSVAADCIAKFPVELWVVTGDGWEGCGYPLQIGQFAPVLLVDGSQPSPGSSPPSARSPARRGHNRSNRPHGPALEFGTKVGCRRAREQMGAHAVVVGDRDEYVVVDLASGRVVSTSAYTEAAGPKRVSAWSMT